MEVLVADDINGAVDQTIHSVDTVVQNAASCSGLREVARFAGCKRQFGRPEEVAQFDRKGAHALVLRGIVPVGFNDVMFSAKGGDSMCNGIIKATIQRTEFVDRERRIALDREGGDDLAQVAVVVDHFVHGKSQAQHVFAV